MSNWSKEEKEAYSKSEVFAEYERNFMEKIKRLSNFVKNSEDIAQKTKNIKDLDTAVTATTPKLKEFVQTLNSADDHELEKEDDMDDNNEVVLAKALDELQIMKNAAFDNGDISLVYKIERTIDELLDIRINYENK